MRRLVLATAVSGGLALLSGGGASQPAATATVPSVGIHKIKHVIIIMQENRSFDSYFGTYPGADGIPMQNGVLAACVPDPATGGCVKPFVITRTSTAAVRTDRSTQPRISTPGRWTGSSVGS